MKIQRVVHRDGLNISDNFFFLIIDSSCDQSIISPNSFFILSRSGKYFYTDGTIIDQLESEFALEVVDTVTLIILQNKSKFILRINQLLLDTCDSQTESLLQPHQ